MINNNGESKEKYKKLHQLRICIYNVGTWLVHVNENLIKVRPRDFSHMLCPPRGHACVVVTQRIATQNARAIMPPKHCGTILVAMETAQGDSGL